MSEKKAKINVAEVVRHDGPICLPETLGFDDAITVLIRQRDYEEQEIEINEVLDCFPWEGAIAVESVIRRRFGFARVDARTVQGFFGPMEVVPQIISVEVGPDEMRNVIWGNFALPGLPRDAGFASMTHGKLGGRIAFALNIETKRKYEGIWREIVDDVKHEALLNSLYRNKAFRIQFTNDRGQVLPLPEIKFMRVSTLPDEVIFTRRLETSIQTNLWTPIRFANECRKLGTPLKRGVLLSGAYGTGKTLLAHATASVALESGWTFIYINKVSEIADAVRFADRYGQVVLFAEDIDRVTKGERTTSLDEILNVIDGIETKNTEVTVVLTTNHVEDIHEAMLRTGRLDVVLDVVPPDADAAIRLVELYGGELIQEGEDLSEVGTVLAGNIPADIREVVERSKLSYLRRTGSADGIELIAQDLLDAALDMQNQKDFIKRSRAPKEETNAVVLEQSLRRAVDGGLNKVNLPALADQMNEVYNRVCE